MQRSVHSVDGKLANIEWQWVQKYVHIQRSVLGAEGGCSLALKDTTVNQVLWPSLCFNNLTNTVALDMLVRRTTWSKLGWRSWRCVRFRYSRSLHSKWVEKLKSWHCCGPLLHWRRKTRGSRKLITTNSCSWGNFLSGRKGRSCRDGTEEGRVQWMWA